MRRMSRAGLSLGLLAVALAAAPRSICAQATESRRDSVRDSAEARERAVRRLRSGAGLRAGVWSVTGLGEVSGASYSTWPALEGYWRRGVDRHLVIETGVGVWRRSKRASSSAGNESVDAYVIPLMTAVRLFPATGPDQPLEPYLTAGAGFTLGVEDANTVSGGILGGSSSGGPLLILGLGLKGGAGIEYRLGSAFGVTAGAGYQFVRFFDYVGGERTYKGVQVLGGLTYRFQY